MITKVLNGIVRGRIVELDNDSGIEEGKYVEVILRTRRLPGPPPGWRADANESAAGLLAASWTEDDDRILDEIYQQRKRDIGREIPQ